MDHDEQELKDLLHRVALGDQTAFARLYERTAKRLFGVCVKLLGQRETAEEVLQEVYVRIWHQAERYSATRGGVITWMISMARYRSIDRLRYSGRRPETDMEELPQQALVADTPGPQDATAMGADAHSLGICLDELGPQQRQAIQLAFLQGLSHGEVCEQLDSPRGSVKSWIRRGLQALRQCLQR